MTTISKFLFLVLVFLTAQIQWSTVGKVTAQVLPAEEPMQYTHDDSNSPGVTLESEDYVSDDEEITENSDALDPNVATLESNDDFHENEAERSEIEPPDSEVTAIDEAAPEPGDVAVDETTESFEAVPEPEVAAETSPAEPSSEAAPEPGDVAVDETTESIEAVPEADVAAETSPAEPSSEAAPELGDVAVDETTESIEAVPEPEVAAETSPAEPSSEAAPEPDVAAETAESESLVSEKVAVEETKSSEAAPQPDVAAEGSPVEPSSEAAPEPGDVAVDETTETSHVEASYVPKPEPGDAAVEETTETTPREPSSEAPEFDVSFTDDEASEPTEVESAGVDESAEMLDFDSPDLLFDADADIESPLISKKDSHNPFESDSPVSKEYVRTVMSPLSQFESDPHFSGDVPVQLQSTDVLPTYIGSLPTDSENPDTVSVGVVSEVSTKCISDPSSSSCPLETKTPVDDPLSLFASEAKTDEGSSAHLPHLQILAPHERHKSARPPGVVLVLSICGAVLALFLVVSLIIYRSTRNSRPAAVVKSGSETFIWSDSIDMNRACAKTPDATLPV